MSGMLDVLAQILCVCVESVIYLSQYHIARQFLSTYIQLLASRLTVRSDLAFTSFSVLIGLNYLVHIFLATC